MASRECLVCCLGTGDRVTVQLFEPDRSTASISFTVIGRPQPAGSKKAFRHPHTGRIIVTDDAKKSRPWKQEIAAVAAEHAPEQLLAGPLMLVVYFYVARPKGHYGSGRNAMHVKPSAPEFPTVRPDVTKLLRALEDACTGILWRDDAQIVDQYAFKRYDEPERVTVHVTSL
jgi:Holliday junction resolvase RusA-like endonuclease